MAISIAQLNAEPEVTPPGKRTIRENIWGNIVGYVAGRRFKEFGVIDSFNRKHAKAWVEGRENTNWWED